MLPPSPRTSLGVTRPTTGRMARRRRDHHGPRPIAGVPSAHAATLRRRLDGVALEKTHRRTSCHTVCWRQWPAHLAPSQAARWPPGGANRPSSAGSRRALTPSCPHPVDHRGSFRPSAADLPGSAYAIQAKATRTESRPGGSPMYGITSSITPTTTNIVRPVMARNARPAPATRRNVPGPAKVRPAAP
jgi:hypothetical protein